MPPSNNHSIFFCLWFRNFSSSSFCPWVINPVLTKVHQHHQFVSHFRIVFIALFPARFCKPPISPPCPGKKMWVLRNTISNNAKQFSTKRFEFYVCLLTWGKINDLMFEINKIFHTIWFWSMNLPHAVISPIIFLSVLFLDPVFRKWMLMTILSVYFGANPLAAVVSRCQISSLIFPRFLRYGGLLSTQKRRIKHLGGEFIDALKTKNVVLGFFLFLGILVTALLMGSFPTYFFWIRAGKKSANYWHLYNFLGDSSDFYDASSSRYASSSKINCSIMPAARTQSTGWEALCVLIRLFILTIIINMLFLIFTLILLLINLCFAGPTSFNSPSSAPSMRLIVSRLSSWFF